MADVLNQIEERTLHGYDLLRDDCGLIETNDIVGVILSGDDRKGWLQGQVTNDVRRLESGNSAAFCLCSATGQAQAVVTAWALPSHILMTTSPECLPVVLNRVEQMVILEDVSGETASARWRLFSVQGPSATRRLSEIVELPNLDAHEATLDGETVWCLRSDRTGLGGWDIWIPAHCEGLHARMRDTFEPIDGEAVDIARLEAGIPKFGADIDTRTLPPEMGAAFENRHISYKKGCYMGQEVLMRIHSRGHTNRVWVGLVAEGELEAGAAVFHPRRADAGKVTSAVVSPDYGPIAGAMLRSEIAEPGDTVRVTTSKGVVEAVIRRMPLLRLE